MKGKCLSMLICMLFISSAFSIAINGRDYGKENTGENVIATITYKSNECSIATLQPIVVITQPADGAVVTDPHLTVLGYATDEIGMNYWEWEWHWKGGSYSNSSYFETAEYVEFKIDIYGLHPGWNLIIVRFKNIYGTIGEDSVNVTYNPPDNVPPTVTIDEPANGQVFTGGADIHVRGTATDNVGVTSIGYTHEWEGGGTGSSWPIPPTTSYPFDIPITLHEGQNRIKVEATDAAGNYGEDEVIVTYTPDTEPPVVVIESPEDGATFTEASITVTGHATDNVGVAQISYTHEWEGGSTGDSWSITPTTYYPFSIPITLHKGLNRIEINAMDQAGNTGRGEVNVRLVEPLSAEADGPYHGKVKEDINFQGSASGGVPPYTWSWNFGDGSTSNEQNPKHAYNNAGHYVATLTVKDSDGNTATDSADVTVYKELVAEADGPYGGLIGEVIQFNGAADGGVPPYTWSWSFGDGSFGNVQNPVHAYDGAGTYTATLTVTDSIGNTAQDIAFVYIYTEDNTAPAIEIVKPKNGFYINDRKIAPLPRFSIVIGDITIEANATDNIGIARVDFYIDNSLKHTNYSFPYYWLWNETAMGRHVIKVIAYDFAGNSAMDEQKVWIFNT